MAQLPADRRRQRLSGLLPVLYFALAYLSLAAAFAEVAIEPRKVTGFFYHPRMIAVVHLITLGWISSSILGALHLVGPMALRTAMPARRLDYAVFAGYALGATGVVSHFWIEEYSGVAWSGLLVILAFAHVGRKLLGSLRSAPVPPEVLVAFAFAFANVGWAAVAGTLLGLNKHWPFLPGHALTHAFAHAHLAALGWATMMVFAAGYRLLPMFFPAAMPGGALVWTSVLLLEAGTLALFVAFLARASWLPFAATVAGCGIAAFLSRVGWMLRRPRPAPKALIRPDYGVLQVLASLVYLVLASVLGLALAWSPETTETTLRLASVYGVLGLVGFLSQIVAGVSARLLPLFARLVAAGWSDSPPSPHALPDRRWQAATLVLWTLGVPVLAIGSYLETPIWVGAGGWLLLGAVLAGAAAQLAVLRAARAPAQSAG